LRRPRGTLYPQKLALTSPTSGGRSIGIIRSLTKTTEFFFCPHLFGSDPVTIAVWLVSLYPVIMCIHRRTVVLPASVHSNSLWQKCSYSLLIVSKTLLISISAPHFSKPANLFENSAWYYSLRSSIWNRFFTHRQCIPSTRECRSLSKCYQFDCLSIVKCPSKFMNIKMWEHCTVAN
jgi:hypothetical protein